MCVVDKPLADLWCQSVGPKVLDAFDQEIRTSRTPFSPQEVFHHVPHVLDGIQISGLGRGLPPINPILIDECFRHVGSMLRVIVL